MKTIKFAFRPDGTVKIEPKGYQGSECLAATKPYEDALGGKALSDAKLPEFYQTEKIKQGA